MEAVRAGAAGVVARAALAGPAPLAGARQDLTPAPAGEDAGRPEADGVVPVDAKADAGARGTGS